MKFENLFSYGTLQLEAVQLSIFGRKLKGASDSLSGYTIKTLKIKDKNVVTASGTDTHPILHFTGNEMDRVIGYVFELTAAEIHKADLYETGDYQRVQVTLCSGINTWVYIAAN